MVSLLIGISCICGLSVVGAVSSAWDNSGSLHCCPCGCSGFRVAAVSTGIVAVTLPGVHIEDPIRLRQSIRVTTEHAAANRRSDDWSRTAYWYQAEPHSAFPKLPPPIERLP